MVMLRVLSSKRSKNLKRSMEAEIKGDNLLNSGKMCSNIKRLQNFERTLVLKL